MKVICTALFVGLMGGLTHAQEKVPPAFEKSNSDNQEQVIEEIDLFDPSIGAPKNVRVQMEYIDVSQKDLTRLMMEDKSTTTDAKSLRMKVQELVDKDVAKIIDTQMVISRSGQKSTTESIQEVIYPTEYNPPNLNLDDESKDSKVMPVTVGDPVAFETRNAGSTFEVEPTISEDDKIVDIRILAQQVWFTGNTIWYEAKDQLGNVNKKSMPDFYKVGINTCMTVISGQYLLAAIVSPKDVKGQVDPERKVMAFLKCDVLSAIP